LNSWTNIFRSLSHTVSFKTPSAMVTLCTRLLCGCCCCCCRTQTLIRSTMFECFQRDWLAGWQAAQTDFTQQKVYQQRLFVVYFYTVSYTHAELIITIIYFQYCRVILASCTFVRARLSVYQKYHQKINQKTPSCGTNYQVTSVLCGVAFVYECFTCGPTSSTN
jgi:hypothetical protein